MSAAPVKLVKVVDGMWTTEDGVVRVGLRVTTRTRHGTRGITRTAMRRYHAVVGDREIARASSHYEIRIRIAEWRAASAEKGAS